MREGGRTTLRQDAHFLLDWHRVGLPLVHTRGGTGPTAQYRHWLESPVVIAVCPHVFQSSNTGKDPFWARDAANLFNWVRTCLAESPSPYNALEKLLKAVMADFALFRFETFGTEPKELVLKLARDSGPRVRHDFRQLSDGKKVLFLAVCLVAAFQADNPIICSWDKPDNFIEPVRERF